jgi:hypothetical protein
VVARDNPPAPLAVMITVYVPALPLHESVEVPNVPSVTLDGVRLQEMPFAGFVDVESATVPV